jgi:hypothetical protein
VAAWGGGKVQVGEELNMPAPLDGGSPGCFEAVAAGVATTSVLTPSLTCSFASRTIG